MKKSLFKLGAVGLLSTTLTGFVPSFLPQSTQAIVSEAAVIGDDYPSTWKNRPLGATYDSWGMATRYCTSFVANRLSRVNKFNINRSGYNWNANMWGSNARSQGYRVDMNPAVGSVAWWSSMHVAWVAEVSGNQVLIEEYNYGYTGSYHKRWISKNSVSGDIHFKDLGRSNTPAPKPNPTPIPKPTPKPTVKWKLVASNGVYTAQSSLAVRNEPKASSKSLATYTKGQRINYDYKTTYDGYNWISYISGSGVRRYVAISKVGQSTSTPTSSWKLVSSRGSYLVPANRYVRSQPKKSSPVLATYTKGERINYDYKVNYDGKTWISYISGSGARRYVAIN